MTYDLTALEMDYPLPAVDVTVELENRPRTWDERSSQRRLPSGRLRHFYEALVVPHPDLQRSSPNDASIPWATGLLGPWRDAVEMRIQWARHADVAFDVVALAMQAGISVHDPQQGLVYHPPRITESTGTTISCPHLWREMRGYAELVTDLMGFLPELHDPYLIVRRSERFYMQTVWEEGGWVLEYRDGTAARHFALAGASATETEEALIDYMRDGTAWRDLAFEKLIPTSR